jgi:hypothetical protein
MMDAGSGKALEVLPIRGGVGANIFEAQTGLPYVSTVPGKIRIFHEDSREKPTALETVRTEFGAKTVGLDTKTHPVFFNHGGFWSSSSCSKQGPSRGGNENRARTIIPCLGSSCAASLGSPFRRKNSPPGFLAAKNEPIHRISDEFNVQFRRTAIPPTWSGPEEIARPRS